MTGPAETKESLRQRLTAIQHKDRWDDRDRKEVRAIQAALSSLAQHIPAPQREHPEACCGAHAAESGRTRNAGTADESASPASRADGSETAAAAGQASCTGGGGPNAGGRTP